MRSNRLVAAASLAGLLASACVSSGPGVDIRSVQTAIVFGVKDVSAGVTPPGFNGPLTPTRLRIEPLEPRPFPTVPIAEKVKCPEAALTAFAGEEATGTIDHPPAVGHYVWQRSGKVELTALPFPVPIDGFDMRTVQEIGDALTGDFTFQTVQTDVIYTATGPISEVVVTTWGVKNESISQPVDVPESEVRLRPGEPESGLTLDRIDRFTPKGEAIGTFEPVPPITYLPLPVFIGETWTAGGTDPVSGQSLTHQARVLRRQRVDACGEFVDGWYVESTQQFVGASSSTRDYDYVVGTAMGGLLISEHVQLTSVEAKVNALYEIGQLTPDPPKDGS